MLLPGTNTSQIQKYNLKKTVMQVLFKVLLLILLLFSRVVRNKSKWRVSWTTNAWNFWHSCTAVRTHLTYQNSAFLAVTLRYCYDAVDQHAILPSVLLVAPHSLGKERTCVQMLTDVCPHHFQDATIIPHLLNIISRTTHTKETISNILANCCTVSECSH